jgi:ADP-dependent NAD(P)H-hydrate dehydratase / NAD(P)H-hydrate epimerase
MGSLYTVAEIRGIEKAASAQLGGSLMLRAGQAGANLALQLLAGQTDPRVLVLAGPGNNGGDALEVAANLDQAGVDVSVLHLPGQNTVSAETARALARARAGGAQFIDTMPALQDRSLIVDGLVGVGLTRAMDGAFRDVVVNVNKADCPVLALDVPSGLNADTGTVVGYPTGVAVRATHTITFIGDKPGLHTCEGQDYAGKVTVAPLELDPGSLPPASAQLNELAMFARYLRPRRHNSHKGSFGNVVVVGGAQGMNGAPILAARAALYSGAGRVYVTPIDPGQRLDHNHPELMFRDTGDFDYENATIIAGPGMGMSEQASYLLARVLDYDSALVLDADALNRIAQDSSLQAKLEQRSSATILTPHPLEAARLLGLTSAAIQENRVQAARTLATKLNATLILKGSGSVVASPGGAIVINPTGNPGLATPGSGDVLAGLCGSLLAQGWPEWETALAATWIHGAAADGLVSEGIGPIGLTAGELPAEVRAVLNALVAAHNARDGRRQS